MAEATIRIGAATGSGEPQTEADVLDDVGDSIGRMPARPPGQGGSDEPPSARQVEPTGTSHHRA